MSDQFSSLASAERAYSCGLKKPFIVMATGEDTMVLKPQCWKEINRVFRLFLCASIVFGMIGIELALRGLGIWPGDEVVLAAYDFPGNFRCIEAIGARPVLADIASASWSLCPESFEA